MFDADTDLWTLLPQYGCLRRLYAPMRRGDDMEKKTAGHGLNVPVERPSTITELHRPAVT